MSGRGRIRKRRKLHLCGFLHSVRRHEIGGRGKDGCDRFSSECRLPPDAHALSLLYGDADDDIYFPMHQPDRIGGVIFHLPLGVDAGKSIIEVHRIFRWGYQVAWGVPPEARPVQIDGSGGRIGIQIWTGKYPQRLVSLLCRLIFFLMGGAEKKLRQLIQRRLRQRKTVSVIGLGIGSRPPPPPQQ